MLPFDVHQNRKSPTLEMSGGKLVRKTSKFDKAATQFWLLSAFLVFVFFTGGSSRADVQSLAMLGPMSVLVCGVALITLPLEVLLERKWFLAVFFLIFISVVFYTINFPQGFRQQIIVAELPRQIDMTSQMGSPWRSLTVSPSSAWTSMLSLFTPLAVVLLAIQLSRKDIYRLVYVVAMIGALSGFLGVLQAAGGEGSAFYLYDITNDGSAVGLFANRNHAAIFLACIVPILAFYASAAGGSATDLTRRRYLAGAVLVTILPLILVTGSRSGLLVFLVGTIGTAFLFKTRSTERGAPMPRATVPKGAYLVGALLITVGCLTYFFARAAALDRLFYETQNTESRQQFWAISSNLFWQYLPWGSGAGSFADVYRVIEPLQLLDNTYLNRAHNDWIETAVTFGGVGIAGLLAAVVLFAKRNWTLWRTMDGQRRSVALSRLGGIIILLIAVASLADYPLRTPAMMGLFALSCIWLTEAGRVPASNTLAARDQQKHSHQNHGYPMD